jgi:hypothetical protein
MSTKAKKEVKEKSAPQVAASGIVDAPAVRAASALPAAVTNNLADWGGQNITSKDIVIPKVLAMQGLSKQVTEGVAKFGEFRDSLNSKVLGDLSNPIEFVPFFLEKVWVVFEEKNGTMKFVKTIPIDAENEGYPYEETLNGVKIRRDRTMNFYVLLTKDLAEGNAIPHIISFRRTSMRAGQKLVTTMYVKNMKAGGTPASMVLELKGTKQSNDKGTFVVLDVVEKRASTHAEITEAFTWVKAVQGGRTKADTSDLEQEAKQSSYAQPAGEEQY